MEGRGGRRGRKVIMCATYAVECMTQRPECLDFSVRQQLVSPLRRGLVLILSGSVEKGEQVDLLDMAAY